MKRIIPIITLTAIVLCMMKNVQVKADTLPASYEILAGQPGVDLTSVISAYEALNSEQKLIAEYLVGAYNNIYLTARGFKYSIPYDQTSLQAQFSALGSRVFDFITTRIGWKSRVNETFRQFLSSTVIYAYGIHTTFANWFDGQVNGTDRIVFIPYTEDAFDAWTTFYNDPSGDGIYAFGYTETDWQSGSYYDFGFVGYGWRWSAQQDAYNDFILNYSPVLYSDTSSFNPHLAQIMIGDFNVIPNCIYVLRSDTSYNHFRFGFVDETSGNYRVLNSSDVYRAFSYYLYNGVLIERWNTTQTSFRYNIVDVTGTYTLREIIDYAFNISPVTLKLESSGTVDFSNAWPFIKHVYIVDNLNTLSNLEQVYNTSDLDIVQPDIDKYIIAPNGRLILPSWPGAPEDPLGFWDLIVDNSFTEEGDEVTDDDYHTSIVNNNVTNNYYVTDDVKINVPVDWFENIYTDQLNTDAQDFIVFAKDCVDCLGDFDIYMYGAIVVGLAGGIVKKLLL